MTKKEKKIDRADEIDMCTFAPAINWWNDISYWEDVYEYNIGLVGPKEVTKLERKPAKKEPYRRFSQSQRKAA